LGWFLPVDVGFWPIITVGGVVSAGRSRDEIISEHAFNEQLRQRAVEKWTEVS
jgi:hypothetical protein